MPREQVDEDEYDANHGENVDASVGEPETTIAEFKCSKCGAIKRVTEKELHENDFPEHHGKPMKRIRTYEKV